METASQVQPFVICLTCSTIQWDRIDFDEDARKLASG